ncbi:50S ribosomal protein L11 methyltransferase [Thermodesulfobacteriota bacterium]
MTANAHPAGVIPETGCPYGDLYIYYVEGQVSSAMEERFGASYIGNWLEDTSSFLFFSAPADAEVGSLISEAPGLVLADRFRIAYDHWQQDVSRPLEVGRFCVAPPWVSVPVEPGKTRIFLDPGVVFGTGTHPTTRDCLRALERVFAHFRPESMLDLGTGTGLLAVAAALLGCATVTAVDCNPLAVKTAKKNVALNDLCYRVKVVAGRAEDLVRLHTDLVVANIHFDAMQRLLKQDAFLDKKSFVLSGLMRSEVRDVMQVLGAMPVTVCRVWAHDSTWYTLWGCAVGRVA